MPRYLIHGPDGAKRVYHGSDRQHRGPSVSLKLFVRGIDPPPLPRPRLDYYAAPDVGRLVTERQAGQVPAPPPPPRPHVSLLACRGCGRISGCTCGTPAFGGSEAAIALQKAQGRR